MNFESEYKKLNTGQKKAVDLIDGPLIVIAGPGTGKTQLLSMRTANILKQTDTLPENILCLTFTEAAAENMRNRLFQLVGNSANRVGIFTFHGFGTYIIQNYPEFFYEAPLLGQLNELGEYDLLQKLMNKLHHDNPFAKKVNESFLHLPSVIRNISWFKQAGLNPADLRAETLKDQSFFESANKFLSKPFQLVPSPKNIGLYQDLLKSLSATKKSNYSKTGEQATSELSAALKTIDAESRFVQPITIWRNKWLTQVKKGMWQFSDMQKYTLLLRLADLYEDYQANLTNSGLYTFDDMILRTNNAIESNEELKLNLQEKYQYILVDEYQDTNGAQDKILNLLADNPINEGKPNLMVVGDDDQAIYRFQGAESSVMLDFIKNWQPETVVLTDSYRSGQALLNLARGIIINAEDRLENSDPALLKKLLSKANNSKSVITELFSPNETENYINTANSINRLIQSGQTPSSIAVLAPKHRYLEALVPYLLNQNLPINYERREQVLAQPKIVDLLNLIELISAASHFKKGKLEALLPKVLSAEYWQLSANDLWIIAIEAQKNHKGWLKVIETSNNHLLNSFTQTIKIMAKYAKNQSFDLLLAYLTGTKSIKLENGQLWDIPWRNYYFSEKQLKKDPAAYIGFISQLETLRHAFREWQPADNRLITLTDFDEFINLFKKTNIKLSDNINYSSARNAVNLMTVYKAKGLEWQTVFILNIEEDVWGTKARSRNQTFSLPTSLKWVEPAVDSSNELVRLFYVGITRAKQQLYLTSYDTKANGQAAERLLWLDNLLPNPKPIDSMPTSVVLSSYQHEWQDIYRTPTKDLSLLLKPVIETYKLSSTHLSDFLAVDRGGPKNFLYRHILKIPDELNPNAVYGDSIHKTLEFIHRQVNDNVSMPRTEVINDFFIDKLTNQPLTSEEFKFLKKRGLDNLADWLSKNKTKFNKTDISEHNFSGELIVINGARLTGKIDVIREDDDNLSVIDYKTSLPLTDWTGLRSTAAIRAHNYKDQLLFYKLLVDNSTFIRRKKVNQGVIEFLSPDEYNNFIDLKYNYDNSELDRLKKLIGVVWQKIVNLDLPETDQYAPTIKGILAFEEDLLSGEI